MLERQANLKCSLSSINVREDGVTMHAVTKIND